MSRRARLIFFAVAAAGLAVTLGAGLAGLPSFGSQTSTYAAMLGSTGICASIVVRYGVSSSGLAAIGVAAILIAANPLAGHAVARAIAIRRGAIWSDPADDAAAPGDDR